MRRPGWRTGFFLAAFLFALGALLPLRLAVSAAGLADRGLAARDSAGSVWFGALGAARLGPLPLGDVAARLRFMPLLAGRVRLDLRSADGFHGGIGASRHGFSVDDASGRLAASALPGLPPVALELSDLSFRFADGRCESAYGRVTARFSGEVAGAPLSSTFGGEARCDGRALLLPLVSQAGTERVSLRVQADGRYRADVSLVRGGAPFSTRLEGSFRASAQPPQAPSR